MTARMVGRKKLDALRAVDNWQRNRDVMADEWLIQHGYAPKQAAVMLERVMDGELAECGVSSRTGWLMPEGRWLLREAGK